MERARYLDLGGADPCDAIRRLVFRPGILDRFHAACAGATGGTSGFHDDDFFRHPVDPGRRAVGSACGNWTGYPQWIDTRRLGYTYALYRAGPRAHGGYVRGGKPSALSYIPLSFVKTALVQRVGPFGSGCRPVCAGYPLHTFRLRISHGTAGLCL